jgi:hypothetical protein
VDLDLEGKSAIVAGGRLDIFAAVQIVHDEAVEPGPARPGREAQVGPDRRFLR